MKIFCTGLISFVLFVIQLAGATVEAGDLGDTVFNDANANGIYESSESGLPGVTLVLETCAGTFLSSTVSANDGSYVFADLDEGRYRIKVIAPSGYSLSPASQLNDWTVDSDFDQVTGFAGCRSLATNQSRTAIDAGLYRTNLSATAALGDRVWSDNNGNGVMDANEPGLTDVVVTLSRCDGTLVDSTMSASDGSYRFDNLSAGSYRLSLTIPAGYTVSPLTVGDWSLNNDFDSDGTTACRTLNDGQQRLAVDAGLVPSGAGTGALGNFVWHDLNRNGLQDPGEPGLAGAIIDLQKCDGELVASTRSSASGSYVFRNLPADSYQLRIAPMTGFSLSSLGTGSNYISDSDFDPATGLTDCRALASGQNRLGIDAGLMRNEPTDSGTVVCAGGGTASLGDWVWRDTNGDGIQQRAIETGIGGVTVKLYECAGRPQTGCRCERTPFCTTTTTSNGRYGFTGLAAGAYQLRITVAGTPYRDGPTHVVSHDIDNDFGNHFNDGDVVGYCKVMAAGQNRPGADAGLVPR